MRASTVFGIYVAVKVRKRRNTPFFGVDEAARSQASASALHGANRDDEGGVCPAVFYFLHQKCLLFSIYFCAKYFTIK
jgi:hypothetical protein